MEPGAAAADCGGRPRFRYRAAARLVRCPRLPDRSACSARRRCAPSRCGLSIRSAQLQRDSQPAGPLPAVDRQRRQASRRARPVQPVFLGPRGAGQDLLLTRPQGLASQRQRTTHRSSRHELHLALGIGRSGSPGTTTPPGRRMRRLDAPRLTPTTSSSQPLVGPGLSTRSTSYGKRLDAVGAWTRATRGS